MTFHYVQYASAEVNRLAHELLPGVTDWGADVMNSSPAQAAAHTKESVVAPPYLLWCHLTNLPTNFFKYANIVALSVWTSGQ